MFNRFELPVVIVGHNRTMMTIDVVRSIIRHLKGCPFKFIIGSDRSSAGHVEALNAILPSFGFNYEVFTETTDRFGLGYLINEGLRRAFLGCDFALVIENDMIMRKDLNIRDHLELLSNTNIGNISYKSISTEINNIVLSTLYFKNKTYLIPTAVNENSSLVQFGENLFSKKFIQNIGLLPENTSNTDQVENYFMRQYLNQLNLDNSVYAAIDVNYCHALLNSPESVFCHIGLYSQHADVKWNHQMVPSEYYFLSDNELDDAFRQIFLKQRKISN